MCETTWQEILVKGWIACPCPKKGPPIPCGREDASVGKKRRCRPNCAACKDYPRRMGKRGKPKDRPAGTFDLEDKYGLRGWLQRGKKAKQRGQRAKA